MQERVNMQSILSTAAKNASSKKDFRNNHSAQDTPSKGIQADNLNNDLMYELISIMAKLLQNFQKTKTTASKALKAVVRAGLTEKKQNLSCVKCSISRLLRRCFRETLGILGTGTRNVFLMNV